MNRFPLNETRKFSGLKSPKQSFLRHSFSSIFIPWNRYITNYPMTSSNSSQSRTLLGNDLCISYLSLSQQAQQNMILLVMLSRTIISSIGYTTCSLSPNQSQTNSIIWASVMAPQKSALPVCGFLRGILTTALTPGTSPYRTFDSPPSPRFLKLSIW